ncbi:hypothetical protein V2J09_023808 [Rumex salicifolius]
MRRLCPNFEHEDGLDTVLEVPVPDEMFGTIGGGSAALRWQNMRSWLKSSRFGDDSGYNYGNYNEFMLLFKLVGSSLIPFPVQLDVTESSNPIRDSPSMEASMAKYILHQYIAATGGIFALNSVSSICAVGQVEIISSNIHQSGTTEESTSGRQSCDVGGFVLWQKNPDLWYLELVVSGCKLSAGCDGNFAWSQTSSNLALISRCAPRPLRRFFQGLDPRAIASLFSEAVHIGEKTINEEDCFILKRETTPESLMSQSTPNTELMHHTVWGYFSQRTGLLVQYVDGIRIAHGGRTNATLYRYGGAYNHRGRVEETWRIEEVDFNIWGLSLDSFSAPSDVRSEFLAKSKDNTFTPYLDHGLKYLG